MQSTRDLKIGLLGDTSITNNPDITEALSLALKKQNLELVNKNAGATSRNNYSNYTPGRLIIILDAQSTASEQEQMEKWRREIQSYGFKGYHVKQVFFVKATVPEKNSNPDIEFLSSEVIARKDVSPLVRIDQMKVPRELNEKVMASLSEVTGKKQKEQTDDPSVDTNLTASTETKSASNDASTSEMEEDEGWIYPDTELPSITQTQAPSPISQEPSAQEPTDYLSTQELLAQLSSLDIPDLNAQEIAAIQYLLDLKTSSLTTIDEYITHLKSSFAETLEKEKSPTLSPSKFDAFLESLRFTKQLEKWIQQINTLLSEHKLTLNADVLVPIGAQVIGASGALSEKIKEKTQKLYDTFAKTNISGNAGYATGSLAAILTIDSAEDEKNLSESEKQLTTILSKKDRNVNTEKQALLLQNLEKMQATYKELNRTTHTNDLIKLIDKVKNAKDYPEALTTVQKEFNQQKKHYEKGRYFSRFFSKKLPFMNFNKKLQETSKNFQYPKLLQKVLETEYTRNPSVKILETEYSRNEFQLMIKTFNNRLGQYHNVPGLNKQNISESLALALLEKQNHLQDPNIIKQIFPHLQEHLKLDDQKFSLVIQQLLASTRELGKKPTKEDIIAAAELVMTSPDQQKSFAYTFAALAQTIYHLEAELESTRISLAQAKGNEIKEEPPRANFNQP